MPLRRGSKVCSSSKTFLLLAEPEQLVALLRWARWMKPRPVSLRVLACHEHCRKSINLRRFMQGNKNPLMALLHDQKL